MSPGRNVSGAVNLPALAVSDVFATLATLTTLAALNILAVLASITATLLTYLLAPIRGNHRIKTVWLSSRCSGCAASRSAKIS